MNNSYVIIETDSQGAEHIASYHSTYTKAVDAVSEYCLDDQETLEPFVAKVVEEISNGNKFLTWTTEL
jgi:hypothetical protein